MAEKKFELPEKVVKVKFNDRNPGWIKNPRHAAYFKVEGAYDAFTTAMQRNGQLTNIFTKEEKDFLEKAIGFDSNELSVYNKSGLLFTRMVRLSKDPLNLNLADPHDFIDYRILLSNKDLIAPSIKDKTKKGTYKYYIEDEDDIVSAKKEVSNTSQLAWKAYGKMEDDKDRLIAFLKVYGQLFNKPFQKIAANTKITTLQAQVTSIIEDKMKDFVSIAESEDFDVILTIAEAVEKGIIKKENGKYTGGGIPVQGLSDTIKYLKAPINQEALIMLEQQIKLKSE
jgi:hypothetical protein